MDKMTALLNMPPMQRRGLAFIILVGILSCLLASGWIITNLLTLEANAIQVKRERLGTLKSLVGLRQSLAGEDTFAISTSSPAEFLQGSSEPIIRSELQSRLNSIASAHGLQVISVGDSPTRLRDNIRYAGLQANLSGTIEAMHSTLFDIETSKPYLIIRRVSINATAAAQRGELNGPPEIVAQLQFFGALPPDKDASP